MRSTRCQIPYQVALLALCMIAPSLLGCGGVGSYCEDANACEGGAEADVDACNVFYDHAANRAMLLDCTDAFDAYFDCLVDTSTCNDQDQYIADENCGARGDELSQCLEDQ